MIKFLGDDFIHPRNIGLKGAADSVIWQYAKNNACTIITKDNDFIMHSQIFGAPPKVIYLSIGNCPNENVVELLRKSHDLISEFMDNDSPLLYLS